MAKYAMNIRQVGAYHVYKPNTSVKIMGVWIHTNSEGFRGRDYPIARTYKKRIFFLGDSYTLGWGVEEKDTFHDILEDNLSKIFPTEIINAGMGNFNTELETLLFIQKGLKYHSDKVVVFWGINDTRVSPQKSKWWFLGYSQFITLCWSFSHILAEHLDPAKNYQSYYSSMYKEGQPGLERARGAFLLLKKVCRENNIALQVVLAPELHDLVNYPFKKEHRIIEDFLKDNGIEFMDLTPFFSDWKDPKALWVSSDDAHPNKIGHRLIARYTFDFIQKGLYASGGP